jgi:hypothetical protein
MKNLPVLLGLLCLASKSMPAQGQNLPLAADSVLTDSVITAPEELLFGKVSDERNTPLAGAAVAVTTHPRQLCITNAEGQYLLSVPRTGAEVTVSYQGYQTQALRLSGIPEQDFVLIPRQEVKRDRKGRIIYYRHRRQRRDHWK